MWGILPWSDSHKWQEITCPKICYGFKPIPTHITLANFLSTSIDVGWVNITHATLQNLNADKCAEILRLAPALEYHYVREYVPSYDNLKIFIHSRLRTLDTSDGTIQFLDRINIPSLEEWTQDAVLYSLVVTAMVSLLERSNCRQKILKLHGIWVSPNKLLILFQVTPSLEWLQILFLPTQDHDDALDDILPQIFCSPPVKSTIPADASRKTPLPRLQYMSTSKSQTSDETAMELSKLVDEGAKFQILDTFDGDGDFLENYRKRMGRENR